VGSSAIAWPRKTVAKKPGVQRSLEAANPCGMDEEEDPDCKKVKRNFRKVMDDLEGTTRRLERLALETTAPSRRAGAPCSRLGVSMVWRRPSHYRRVRPWLLHNATCFLDFWYSLDVARLTRFSHLHQTTPQRVGCR
jgi:hypothetical protein